MSEISVIVPVYEAEKHLHRCVDSILMQSFFDFDLILVDDGSRDSSPSICEWYAAEDSRVRVIHQVNSGPSAARNNGIDWAFANSDSSYLTFVDSDDCLHPQFLEYLYCAIKESKTKIAMCRHQYIGEHQQLNKLEMYSSLVSEETNAENLIVEKWSSFNYAWGKLYAKKCFQTLRYPKEVSFGEDNLVVFRAMFEAGRIIFVDNPLYYYFYTPTGITKSPWSPNSLDVFKGIRAQLAYYSEHGYQRAYAKEMELYIQQYAYQIHRIREDKENLRKNKPYIRKMRKAMKHLLRENPPYSAKNQFYWYEALYPVQAGVLDRVGRTKRYLRDFGVCGLLKKIIDTIF